MVFLTGSGDINRDGLRILSGNDADWSDDEVGTNESEQEDRGRKNAEQPSCD